MMSIPLGQAIQQLATCAIKAQHKVKPPTVDYSKVPNTPSVFLLKSYQIKFRYQFNQEVETSKGIAIDILNLSADLRYNRKQGEDSWLEIEVTQIPLPLSDEVI